MATKSKNIKSKKTSKYQAKKITKRELEKIYDSQYAVVNASRKIKNDFSGSLKDNPKLDLALRLMILANIGIWALVLFLVGGVI